MRSIWLFAAVSLTLFVAGCKRETQADLDAKDPAAYARSIKQDVQQFVQEGKQNPKSVKEQAPFFLEKLEAHPSHPVGENGPSARSWSKPRRGPATSGRSSTRWPPSPTNSPAKVYALPVPTLLGDRERA
jgi:hypothetical protein